MKVRAKPFLRKFWSEFQADRVEDAGAMMTYYAIFALFPMLVFVMTIALLVSPQEWIDGAVTMAGSALPPAVTSLLRDQVTRMEEAAGAGFAIGSAALALWGASRGAASLMTALNDMFDKRESRGWVKRQLIAIGTTLVVATLLVVAMALLAAGPSVGHALADRFGLGGAFDTVWTAGRWLIAGFLVMLVWALLYKWLPDVDAPLRIFTPGAIAGVLLWIGVTKLFGIYLDHFDSYEKTYGAVASVIIFMTWLWLSNLTLLIGAEINDVLADLRKDESPAAAKLAHQEKPANEKSTPAADKAAIARDPSMPAEKREAVREEPPPHESTPGLLEMSRSERHRLAQRRRARGERELGVPGAPGSGDFRPVSTPSGDHRPV